MNTTRTKIEELIDHGAALPPLSGLGQDLLTLVRQPIDSIDVTRLAEQAEQDPALAARLLRVANSPVYGQSRSITRVRQAILVMGLDEAIGLLNFYLLRRTFGEIPSFAHFSADQFWKHSWAVATTARLFGNPRYLVNAFPGELFTAGLLHDTGQMILALHLPSQFAVCLEQARREQQPLHVVEEAMFGVNHAVLGAQLLDGWNLPQAILEGIGCHHQPSLAEPEQQPLAAMIQYADAIVGLVGEAPSGNPCPGELDSTWWCRVHANHMLNDQAAQSELIGQVRRMVRDRFRSIDDQPGEEQGLGSEAELDPVEAPRAVPAPRRAAPARRQGFWHRLGTMLGLG